MPEFVAAAPAANHAPRNSDEQGSAALCVCVCVPVSVQRVCGQCSCAEAADGLRPGPRRCWRAREGAGPAGPDGEPQPSDAYAGLRLQVRHDNAGRQASARLPAGARVLYPRRQQEPRARAGRDEEHALRHPEDAAEPRAQPRQASGCCQPGVGQGSTGWPVARGAREDEERRAGARGKGEGRGQDTRKGTRCVCRPPRS
eukprot:COSAG06_NODE_226_length_19747_cov_9.234121_7_plen_200_part_00